MTDATVFYRNISTVCESLKAKSYTYAIVNFYKPEQVKQIKMP